MGSSTSKAITDTKLFTIHTIAYITRNGNERPAVVKHQIKRDINTYLNSFMFENLVKKDLEHLPMDKEQVLRIVVNDVAYNDRTHIVTIQGVIRVDKPKQLLPIHNSSHVCRTLGQLLSRASRGHKYPASIYGHSLGPNNGRLCVRFHPWTTRVTLRPTPNI
jgi:hypothetical protein